MIYKYSLNKLHAMHTHLHIMPQVSPFLLTLILLILIEPLSNHGCSPGSWLRIQSKKWWSKDAETPTFPIIIPLHWPMSSRGQVLVLTWSTHSIQVSQTQLLTWDEQRPVFKWAFQRWADVLRFTFWGCNATRESFVLLTTLWKWQQCVADLLLFRGNYTINKQVMVT